MPSKSKAQQKFMGMVYGLKKGEVPSSDVSANVKKAASSISKSDAEDFASTKHKGKPEHVKKETMVRELIRKLVREIMAELKEVGAAPLYKKHIKSIDKYRDQVGREVLKFYELLRKKGLDDAADTLLDNYKNNILKFGKDLKELVRKLM